jgi:hypothetical protein
MACLGFISLVAEDGFESTTLGLCEPDNLFRQRSRNYSDGLPNSF